MAWLLIASTLVLLGVLSSVYSNIKQYRLAKSTGFPVDFCIFNGRHIVFLIGSVKARRFFARLPWPLSNIGTHGYYGWTYDDYNEGSIHNRLGSIFCLATSWGNELVIADPDVALTLMAKWKVFTKPPTQQALALFGPNLDTVEGNDWNKHRRLTAPCFNERSSGLVWDESRAQAIGMLKKFSTAGAKGIDSVAEDSTTLALNVLTRVAFGQKSDFESGQEVAPGYSMSFQRALQLIMRNLVPCVALGAKLTLPIMPAIWQEAGKGFVAYDKYVQDILDREKEKLESGNDTSNNLISVMLRASQTDEVSSKGQSGTFSEADVKGNCFIFTVAGHDTTANSLALAIALLSARPQLQDWLHEEISAVLGDDEEPDYEKHFPRLVRCQAALYETLRLYPAVPEIPKHTGDSYIPITVNGKEHILPPDMNLLINVVVLHRIPKFWGENVDDWQPQRWLQHSDVARPEHTGNIAKSATTNHASETIKEPVRGSYMPWAEGPRICPGSRFARVEFVATIVTLFRNHRVRPMPLSGETDAQARTRAIAWAKDAHAEGVAINLKRPRDVTLVWESR